MGNYLYKSYQRLYKYKPDHGDLYNKLLGIAVLTVYNKQQRDLLGYPEKIGGNDNHAVLEYFTGKFDITPKKDNLGNDAMTPTHNDQFVAAMEEDILTDWDKFYEFLSVLTEKMNK